MPEARLCVRVERPDLHPRDALREQVARQLVGPVEERVEILVRRLGIAARQPPVQHRLAALVAYVAVAGAGVVGADRVAARAAEHAVERLTGCLAAEVPERDVDRRRGACFGAAAGGADVAAQRVGVQFDPPRILPEQVARGDGVHVRLDRVGEEECLAEPDEPLVGVHEHVEEARELVQPQRVDARDLHAGSFAR